MNYSFESQKGKLRERWFGGHEELSSKGPSSIRLPIPLALGQMRSIRLEMYSPTTSSNPCPQVTHQAYKPHCDTPI